jgi:tetratricopeptide (TPR) repeat protein
MRRPGWRALCLAVALLPAATAIAQEEEDLTEGLRAIHAAYDRARERIEDLDFAGAVRELGAIIDPRRAAKAKDLSLEELRLLCSSYDLRARAHFNLGNLKGAEADFQALIRLNPGYAIDRQTLSPKVVDLFDKVRARIAAILYLQVDPPKARIAIDGEPVEGVPADGIALLAGTRTLRIEHEGYDPHAETMAVIAGAPIRKTLRLRPNRRAIELITVPDGVAVTLDGAPAGATKGPAPPEVLALAAQYGFDPKSASAPLLVPLVTPGEHKVTFERECYQTQTLTVKVPLDPEKNLPLRFAPVVLKEARTDLKVTSLPPGADVYVDGERRGTTPAIIAAVCGGERDVVIAKPGVGSWSERVRLAPGQVNTLDARLRPTLLYAGTFRLDEWGRAVWSDEDRPLLEEIGKGLKTLNLVRSPEVVQGLRDAVTAWMISDPDETRAGTIVPPAILAQAAEKGGADLVLAGLTLHDDPDRTWTLALYSVLHSAPDVVTLRTDRPEGARDLVRRLDQTPPETEPWWGMGLTDTALDPAGGAALVARVLPGSPAAKAGVRVGDRVRAVGNRKTQSARDVEQAIASEMSRPAGLKPTVVMAVDDDRGQRTVRITPGESPVVIPLRDPALLYNRALAEFRLRSRAAREEAERGVALLNLGIAFMHFRAYDKAQSEGFARAGLPKGTGISEGTVLYYRGLCALRRGDPAAALQAFEQAAAEEGSTLDSGDGPSAAAAAARLLRTLGQAP